MVNDILEIKELSYSAGEKDILSDISFSVPRGGFLTIIGPNGAGKSTLLKCAGGLLPCRGGIFVEGRNIKGMSERERAKYIAWVHQGGSDRLPLTVRRFASLSRYPWRPVLAGESEEDRRAVKEALARAGVEALAERTLSSLSGGERQRALLA
nr:ABC transporter ATP-binding protein [Synergistes sp.]